MNEELKPLIKEINFDGCNFWLEGDIIGKIRPKYRFCAVPKEVMIEEKKKCLGKVLSC
jgi:hypothetical protein